MSGRRSRRGFSLVEALVVLALIGAFGATAMYWARPDASVAADLQAKAALSHAYQAQVSGALAASGPLGSSGVAKYDSGRTYGTEASTDSRHVSLTVDGTRAFMAVASTGGSCWMLRLDLEPAAGSPRELWAVRESLDPPCSAQGALVALDPAVSAGRGRSSTAPWIL